MKDLAGLKSELDRWLFDEALPLWWRAGADPDGGFHEGLELDGRPYLAPKRLLVQARQTYAFAEAGRLGWTGPWREAMAHGLAALADYRRADGLYRRRIGGAGQPPIETALLYDQAFVLFALAAVFRETAERDVAQAARALLDRIERRYAHDAGGLREDDPAAPFQSNPHMHLFEAALAWSAVDPDPTWTELADRLAELCLTRFIDRGTGALREFFAPDWTPAPGEAGREIWPGHQFEWTWLLQRWGTARGRSDACMAARRLFEVASRHGIDRERGVAVFSLADDLSPLDRKARLWAQTEWLKAALILAEATEETGTRAALQAEAVAAGRGLRLYLDTPVPGAWRDKIRPEGGFVEEPSPATSFYHIVCALSELRARSVEA